MKRFVCVLLFIFSFYTAFGHDLSGVWFYEPHCERDKWTTNYSWGKTEVWEGAIVFDCDISNYIVTNIPISSAKIVALKKETDKTYSLTVRTRHDKTEYYRLHMLNSSKTEMRIEESIDPELSGFFGQCGEDRIFYKIFSPPPKDFSSTHCTVENLRLRDNTGTSGKIVTTLPKDTDVQVLETGGQETIDGITAAWVRTGTGYEGWCFSGYLQTR